MVYIDPRLLDLMSAVQAWLQYYGIKSPLYITSGFRTPQTNYGLEGAAKNSMHMHGKAIDFYVPQLNVKYVAKKIAEVKKMKLEEIANITYENANNVYKIKK